MNLVSLVIYILWNMIFIQVIIQMKAVQASDEIVCRFAILNGGLEAAMPFIAYQFKRAGADFSDPTKEQLRDIVEGLIRLLTDCKPQDVVEREKRIMLRWIDRIEPT
jgi:hypothetical protein